MGVHAHIEKPDSDIKKHDSNVEYIINHMDSLGLIPPPETAEEAAARQKAEKEAAEKEKAEKEEKKKRGEKEPEAAPLDIPRIIIGKIQVGDIGAGVIIRNVPHIGRIAFHPKIGMIHFDNVQQQIFGGREDLTPEQSVACIIQAICAKIAKTVTSEIPGKIAEKLKHIAEEAMHKGAEKIKNMT